MSSEEVEARLREGGIPLARSGYAADVDEVASVVSALGVPRVALKAAGLLHKSDSGGVVLDLEGPEAAAVAAAEMHERLGERALPFLVQEQARGMEMLVGLRRDPQLGAAVVVGLGGVQTEIHQDVARRLLPVDTQEAVELLTELRSWPLLDGFRGSARRDVEGLARIVAAVSALGQADETIVELDCNPVLVGEEGTGCTVVDARIVRGDAPPARTRRRRDLDRMLRPNHIAVVGVSDDPTKVGARLFRYLDDHGFPGRLDPVHPAGGTVRGYERATSLEALGASPDLVCVAVPAKGVPDVARQAVAVGAGGVLVHSSDFAEVGEEGQALQDQVAAILDEAAIPLAGPNNMGVVAPGRHMTASISGGLEMAELVAGDVGLLTSSGALGSCLATRLMGAGVGLSYWAHVGNEADLVLADLLEWLVDDPGTASVGLLVEDIKDGERFVEAGRAMAAAGKPMFAYNMVRSAKGRDAALSHTGAMVGSFELREEVMRAAGMVSVPSLRVLEDALLLTSAYGLPRGSRLVAITFSGGACTIIADEADTVGVQLPDLSEATRDRVAAHVPSYAAVRNPMDTSYQMISSPDSFGKAIDGLLADDEFDAALVAFTTNADPPAERSAEAVISVNSSVDVPIYVSRFGGEQIAPKALARYAEAGLPVLDAPDRAVQAIGAVMAARRAVDAHS